MKAFLSAFLLAAMAMGFALTSSAAEGAGPADNEEHDPSGEKVAAGVPAAAEPRGGAPMVEFAEGRLSVDVRDQAFGDVVAAISNAAGFEVELSNDVFQKRLTTRFKNTELKRGLQRLLSLMEQKNYFIGYNPRRLDQEARGLRRPLHRHADRTRHPGPVTARPGIAPAGIAEARANKSRTASAATRRDREARAGRKGRG